MSHRTAEMIERDARRVLGAMVSVAVGLLVLAGAVMFTELRPGDAWSPLGPYPVQQVNLPHSNIDGLPQVSQVSLASHGTVPVTGTKCVSGSGFDILGTSSWQSMDPRGTVIRTGEGSREAVAGCTRIEFDNVIPVPVRRAMETQLETRDRVVWRIMGVETPTDGTREGAPLVWRTESFAVIP